MRFTGKCVILCTPMNLGNGLTGTTSKFVPFGMGEKFFDTNKLEDKKSRCLWKTTPLDTTTERGEHFMGYIVLNLGRIAKLEKTYEKLKKLNYIELESKGGGVGAVTDDKQNELKLIAERLYNWARDNFNYPDNIDNPAKVILKTYIRESGIGRGRSTGEIRDIENYVVRYAKWGGSWENPNLNLTETDQKTEKKRIKKVKKSIQANPDIEFEYDIDEILAEIGRTSKKPKIIRNIEIYRHNSLNGLSYRDILKLKKQHRVI